MFGDIWNSFLSAFSKLAHYYGSAAQPRYAHPTRCNWSSLKQNRERWKRITYVLRSRREPAVARLLQITNKIQDAAKLGGWCNVDA